MIPLTNHDFQWGRSEVVIIYPDHYHHHFLWLFYPQYWLTSGRNARITLTSSRFLADAQDTHLGSAGSASTKNFRSTQTGRNWAEAIAMHWRKMMTWYIVNVKKHILVGGFNGKIWEHIIIYIYMVGGFNLPLWKICVRQLGWWHSQLNGKS